jgi:hypothetical protein
VIAMLVAILVVRQMMEVGSALQTVLLELRLLAGAVAIFAALVLGSAAACACKWLGSRLRDREFLAAVRTFSIIFAVQCGIYTIHELSEARLLPYSEVIHAATEVYGPDGIYGMHLSDALVLMPVAAIVLLLMGVDVRLRRRRVASSGRALTASLGFASLAMVAIQGADATRQRDRLSPSQSDIDSLRAKPHLLFRDLSPTSRFGMLSIAPLDAPETRRLATQLPCDRISFAAGHGLCLRTVPGVFFNYTSAVLDASLNPVASIRLDGRPSRTRTSPDGRVGATTVFVFGDKYAAEFSTRTKLVDMSSGDVIGDLETFSTWRNGARFSAVDFNFWGVTFATDHNTFYASLGTAGGTYLVRGELGLRKLTVIREGVECPSLSPDNKRIAFKKRVGSAAGKWRLAVLDLDTMNEQLVSSETRSIDDQVEWFDSGRLLYAVPNAATTVPDIWQTGVDGNSPARLFLPQAESPIVVR